MSRSPGASRLRMTARQTASRWQSCWNHLFACIRLQPCGGIRPLGRRQARAFRTFQLAAKSAKTGTVDDAGHEIFARKCNSLEGANAPSRMNQRKLYIKSYGCQMNVYDSNRMADLLAPEGYVETAVPDDADLIILNTCHIREKAAEKAYSGLCRVRELKESAGRERPRVTGAGAGCVAQGEG